jgi:pyrimidine-specific ribonucleoside hydrolase
MITRREMLISSAVALAGTKTLGGTQKSSGGRTTGIPIVHLTDLYHPPQDPDDHFDLATLAALPELDLRGVILDATSRFLRPAPAGADIARDPGLVPVSQMGYLLGRSIPVAVGPTTPLEHPGDDLSGRPAREQAGARLLLDLLEASRVPVVISVVGSARPLTAAFNKDPQLVRQKVHTVLLNAGSTGGKKQEWNVGLDPAAYVGLWRSGLPIDWYPCATEGGAFSSSHERGTYWKAPHRDLLKQASRGLKAWFAYALTASPRGDIIRILEEVIAPEVWEGLLTGSRNMWTTASLVMAAGRVLKKTPDGWRFAMPGQASEGDVWPWRLDPIDAEIGEDAVVAWRPAGKPTARRLFGRRPGAEFGQAMTEGLGALLSSLHV